MVFLSSAPVPSSIVEKSLPDFLESQFRLTFVGSERRSEHKASFIKGEGSGRRGDDEIQKVPSMESAGRMKPSCFTMQEPRFKVGLNVVGIV